ncbi:MAG TPA: hypothetical protein VFX45_06645 [Solirubrobacterales bacterium]|nr:hypothetical protein [Solirubrobacterales bacterium]
MTDDRHDTAEIDERTERELTQLADGRLRGPKRLALEARISAEPQLAAALERQRVAAVALRTLELEVPAALRARVEAERRRKSAPARRRRLTIAGGLATATAAAALLAVMVLPTGSGEPSVDEAARLAASPATQATVAVDQSNPKLLVAASDGVPFPNLEGEFGWREAGARGDDLDGRHARTVFYERGGRRISYTIVAGEAIEQPPGARTRTIKGVEFASFEADGTRAVTWQRQGHTCVLASRDVSDEKLVELASWTGKGSVPF